MSERAGDMVFTPEWAARDLVRYFQPTGSVLEPCSGDGAILCHLPPDALWCEITKGRDFFAWSQHVDWIISNPPYSKLRPFLKHAFRVADNVAFLVPARNVFSGYGTVREARDFGRMRHLRWYGTGAKLGFPMGNAIAAIHWQRGYAGACLESFVDDERSTNLCARQVAA
jgi:hypothetical protein